MIAGHATYIREGEPVLWARSVGSECLHVTPRGIPLVPGEAVDGITGMQIPHQPVPGDLRDYRGSRHACGYRIPFPHGQGRHAQAMHREPVGQHIFRLRGQARQGTAHPGDIAYMQARLVDLPWRYDYDVPGEGYGHHFLVGDLSRGRRQRLRIGDAVEIAPPAGIEGDGSYHQGARASTAAGFIDPGHAHKTGPGQRSLVTSQACRTPGCVTGVPPLDHSHCVTGPQAGVGLPGSGPQAGVGPPTPGRPPADAGLRAPGFPPPRVATRRAGAAGVAAAEAR